MIETLTVKQPSYSIVFNMIGKTENYCKPRNQKSTNFPGVEKLGEERIRGQGGQFTRAGMLKRRLQPQGIMACSGDGVQFVDRVDLFDLDGLETEDHGDDLAEVVAVAVFGDDRGYAQ